MSPFLRSVWWVFCLVAVFGLVWSPGVQGKTGQTKPLPTRKQPPKKPKARAKKPEARRKKLGAKLKGIVFQSLPGMYAPQWKPLDVVFASAKGKPVIKMVGVYVSKPGGYRRGGTVKVSFLFKCLRKISHDWKVFIHGDPMTWTRHRLNWDHAVAQGRYSTRQWKPGEFIVDTIVRKIPRHFPTHYSRVHLHMGFWRGTKRLHVRRSNVTRDPYHRVLAVSLKLLPLN